MSLFSASRGYNTATDETSNTHQNNDSSRYEQVPNSHACLTVCSRANTIQANKPHDDCNNYTRYTGNKYLCCFRIHSGPPGFFMSLRFTMLYLSIIKIIGFFLAFSSDISTYGIFSFMYRVPTVPRLLYFFFLFVPLLVLPIRVLVYNNKTKVRKTWYSWYSWYKTV